VAKIPLSEFDVIFISYDEPNADENWADLQSKCPWAKRSHGVYGSDAAHKAAARLSETDRFITVDADNIIDPEIFNLEFDESIINSERVLSFKGKNIINGLVYGNGGIKCWPVETVMNMKTHEVADSDKSQVDFCWDLYYHQMPHVYSIVHNNASPYQAFRAGFREGCKMSLDEGRRIPAKELVDKIYPDNFKRLKIWMSIGWDVKNGLWAIYGARYGFYLTNMTDWDYVNVRDFEYLTKMWEEEIAPKFTRRPTNKCEYTGYEWDRYDLLQETITMGKKIEGKFPFKIPLLDDITSEFIKGIL